MLLTEEERRLLEAVLHSVREMSYAEQVKLLGSLGVPMVVRLERKLHYYPYCEAHGIRYEDMTEDDFVNAFLELA